jgi:L-amino acid N-acyltransferase YncA
MSESNHERLSANTLTPAGHRRAIKRQLMLEIIRAAERLKVWILQPGRADLFIRQSFHMLQQM